MPTRKLNYSNVCKPPASIIPWLMCESSLTNKLASLAGDARLDVRSQHWDMSDDWDIGKLKLDAVRVMHREIAMWAFDTPCWYARTILPELTYQSNHQLFDRLKNQSLGELIFNSNQIKRVSLNHYMIAVGSFEYNWLNDLAPQDASPLWMRLSEFMVISGHSFYLAEILLPGLLRSIS